MRWLCFKPFIVGFVPVVIVVFLHEQQLSGEDPSNFALAIKYGVFDHAQNRPHAPGYPGFYVVWKIIEWAAAFSPHAVLLTTNTLSAGGASLLTYNISRHLWTSRVALVASMLVITNPMLLYFSNTSELYAYDAAFSAFFVLMLMAPIWPEPLRSFFLLRTGGCLPHVLCSAVTSRCFSNTCLPCSAKK